MRVEQNQGSEEWLNWRLGKVGASQTAGIMGISPWRSKYETFLDITGRSKPTLNAAMQRGNDREEEGRRRYEEKTHTMMIPACYVHDEIPWMIASLDGIDPYEEKILEIKWPKREVIDNAKKGEVPPHYFCQMQHQMACVPTAKSVDFFCCSEDESVLVTVERDKEYIKQLLIDLTMFYVEHLDPDIPPDMDETDVMVIENDPEFAAAARKYLMAKEAVNFAKQEETEARQALLDCTDDGSCRGYGVLVKKYYDTRVDYKKACEETGIDLNKYKKESQVRWRITEEK